MTARSTNQLRFTGQHLRVAVVAVLGLLGAASTAGCSHETGELVALPPAPEAQQAGTPQFGEAVVTRDADGAITRANGTVEPARVVELGAPFMARIDEVRVTEGQTVLQDAVLVVLDTTVARQQEAQASAQAAANRLQAQHATDEIERLRPLVERGVVAVQQVDALVSQRAALDETTEAVEAIASLARSQRADGSIRAPFAGTVVSVPAEVGAIAAPAATLLRLVDMSEVDIRVAYSEAEIAQVAVGDVVMVRVPALGVEREGRVRFVDPELDPATRTGEVLVRVENADRRLLAGAFASVTSQRTGQEPALVVPANAILGTDLGTFAYVQTSSGVERREVRAARRPNGSWTVESGLQEGERVVTGDLQRYDAATSGIADEGGAP